MRRWSGWLLVFILGVGLGRVTLQGNSAAVSAAGSEEQFALHLLADRQQTLIEAARERYDRKPDDFQAASHLALLLSGLCEVQQRQVHDLGLRIANPVYVPELLILLDQCRRLAKTNAERDLVRGMEVRIQRQGLNAEPSGLDG